MNSPVTPSPGMTLLDWDETSVQAFLAQVGLEQYEDLIYGTTRPLRREDMADDIRSRHHRRCTRCDGPYHSRRDGNDQRRAQTKPPSSGVGVEEGARR